MALLKLLNRTRRDKRKALAERYRKTAAAYLDMGKLVTPGAKPLQWKHYLQIMHALYLNHAEDVEKL
jgi:hypothetical protein